MRSSNTKLDTLIADYNARTARERRVILQQLSQHEQESLLKYISSSQDPSIAVSEENDIENTDEDTRLPSDFSMLSPLLAEHLSSVWTGEGVSENPNISTATQALVVRVADNLYADDDVEKQLLTKAHTLLHESKKPVNFLRVFKRRR